MNDAFLVQLLQPTIATIEEEIGQLLGERRRRHISWLKFSRFIGKHFYLKRHIDDMKIDAMKKEEMTKIVNEELTHIPKGSLRSKQQDFREFYNAQRRTNLRKFPNMSRSDAIKKIIEDFKKTFQYDSPSDPFYDKEWFEKGG